MDENRDYFKIDNSTKKRLEAKFLDFKGNVTEFDLGPVRIQIEPKIYEEFLKISEADAIEEFRSLCLIYLETCLRYKVPLRKSNILLLTDDEISRGCEVMFRAQDGTIWGYIFIPPLDLKLAYGFWAFTFFHELGHCWIEMERPKDEQSLVGFEISSDLVAICALRRLIPPHTKIYRNVLKSRSYVGSVGKKYLDKECYKNILENPEAYLEAKMMERWKIERK